MILTRSSLLSRSGILVMNESVRETRYFSAASADVNVFLSHKHTDKLELHAVKRILEECGAKPYVDWLDPTMPKETRGETAAKLKQKISSCGKFIFVATQAAIDAPWCNWEIGYGDSLKTLKDSIALFAIMEDDGKWSGNEYLQLYPVIEFEDGTTKNSSGSFISRGYYVEYPSVKGQRRITPLKDWLLKK